MNISDALMLKVGIDGVEGIVRGLGMIEGAIGSVAGKASLMRGVGVGLAGAGLGLAASANVAYEKFERMRRSFVAFSGEVQGNSLAKWLSNYATEANTATDALENAVSGWVSATNNVSKARGLVTGLERLGGIGRTPAELERVGVALSQIQTAPTVRADDVNQLRNAQVPLNMIAQELGLKSIYQARGMDSGKFVDAAIRAFNKIPKQAPLGAQAVNNGLESWQNGLKPTGELVNGALVGLGSAVAATGGAFAVLNEKTSGGAGLVLSLGLAAAGGFYLWRSLRAPGVGLLKLGRNSTSAAGSVHQMAKAADKATDALNRLSRCRCADGGPGGARGGPGGGPGGSLGGGPVPVGGPRALPGGGLQPALPGAAAGAASIGIGRAALIGGLIVGGGAVIGTAISSAIARMFDKSIRSPGDIAREHLQDYRKTGDWRSLIYQRGDRRLGGIYQGQANNVRNTQAAFDRLGPEAQMRTNQWRRERGESPLSKMSAATRPQRRASAENFLLDRMASAMGG